MKKLKEYLTLETKKIRIVVSAQNKKFYHHTVNRYKGGLIVGESTNIVNTTADLNEPVAIPEETELNIIVSANDSKSFVNLVIRGAESQYIRVSASVLVTTTKVNSRIGIMLVDAICDSEVVTLALDVCPTKINYDRDYYALIADLQKISRDLAYDYLKSSSLVGKRDKNEKLSDVEFISALDENFKNLKASFNIIKNSPSRMIVRKNVVRRADQISSSKSSLAKNISRGLGIGSFLKVGKNIYVRERIPVDVSAIGYDTPANRWLKQELLKLRARVAHIISINKNTLSDRGNVFSGKRILERLRLLYTELNSMLNQNFLYEVKSTYGQINPNMEVLRKKGYKIAYKIFDSLGKSFSIADGIQLLNSRQIYELYEEWCYLKVASIISEITGCTMDPKETISITGNSFRISFSKGKQYSISINAGNEGKYKVTYNHAYQTITGIHKPDIIIEINKGKIPSTVIILDAKYRLINHDRYGNPIKPQPPADAINALHRYRDAIYVINKKQRVRPVVKGAILYPPEIDSDLNDLPYWNSLQEVGIGAIPLIPEQDTYLKEFLITLLKSDERSLYKPGPSYEPYETIISKGKE